MKCATCGAELIKVGYPKDFYQEYRCPNGCERIFSRKTKIVDAVMTVVFVIAAGVVVLVLAPALKILDFLRRV